MLLVYDYLVWGGGYGLLDDVVSCGDLLSGCFDY